MIRIFSFILVLLLAGCAPRLEGQVEIHYWPSDLSSFVPITPDNIVEMHRRYGLVAVSDPRFQALLAELDAAGPGSFYEGATRVRLRDSNGTSVYLDDGGGIRRSMQEQRLDQASLDRVAELLYSMTEPRISGAYRWAVDATHAYIASHEGWARTHYAIESATLVPKWRGPTVVVKVRHNDDFALFDPRDADLKESGGKSFELHFDPTTKTLIRQLWGQ